MTPNSSSWLQQVPVCLLKCLELLAIKELLVLEPCVVVLKPASSQILPKLKQFHWHPAFKHFFIKWLTYFGKWCFELVPSSQFACQAFNCAFGVKGTWRILLDQLQPLLFKALQNDAYRNVLKVRVKYEASSCCGSWSCSFCIGFVNTVIVAYVDMTVILEHPVQTDLAKLRKKTSHFSRSTSSRSCLPIMLLIRSSFFSRSI